MSSLLIRNLDDRLKRNLRNRAARHGRSMEQEARDILAVALAAEPATSQGLGSEIHALFAPLGGVDLEVPEREPIRTPPPFEE